MNNILVEIVGYIGMILVVASMAMKDLKVLRQVNSIGCAVSFVYSMINQVYPIAIMNFALLSINVYQLYFAKKK